MCVKPSKAGARRPQRQQRLASKRPSESYARSGYPPKRASGVPLSHGGAIEIRCSVRRVCIPIHQHEEIT
jgi:hypothetical protein